MKKKTEALNNEKTPNLTRRKSKNEEEGRTYLCELCQKGYLSYPALYTHKKLKHENSNNQGRGRGRPKKDQNEDIIEKNRYNPINITFFAKEGRTGKTSSKDIDNCIKSAFLSLYSSEYSNRNNSRNMKNYKSLEEHSFLDKFRKDNHDIYKNVIDIHEVIDKVFINYLNKMSEFCNPIYFTELIKFVTLFREYLNIHLNNDEKFEYYLSKIFDCMIRKENNFEYTEIKDAENVPNYCNKFINKFLYPNGNDTDFSFLKDDSIDLIQNICYWLYDNNFTSYKISLKKNK